MAVVSQKQRGQNITLVRHVITMGVVQFTSTASHVAFSQIRYDRFVYFT